MKKLSIILLTTLALAGCGDMEIDEDELVGDVTIEQTEQLEESEEASEDEEFDEQESDEEESDDD